MSKLHSTKWIAARRKFAKAGHVARLAQTESRLQWLRDSIQNSNATDCLIWPYSRTHNGYGRIIFNGRRERTHRISFFLVHGHWPTPMARHSCDNPPCFNPKHILEGTNADNQRDMIERGRGRKAVGERAGKTKLNETIVREIRASYIPKHRLYGATALAKKYGVTYSTIFVIIMRKSWKHIH